MCFYCAHSCLCSVFYKFFGQRLLWQRGKHEITQWNSGLELLSPREAGRLRLVWSQEHWRKMRTVSMLLFLFSLSLKLWQRLFDFFVCACLGVFCSLNAEQALPYDSSSFLAFLYICVSYFLCQCVLLSLWYINSTLQWWLGCHLRPITVPPPPTHTHTHWLCVCVCVRACGAGGGGLQYGRGNIYIYQIYVYMYVGHYVCCKEISLQGN